MGRELEEFPYKVSSLSANYSSVCLRGIRNGQKTERSQASTVDKDIVFGVRPEHLADEVKGPVPAKILFSSYLRLVAQLGRRPSIPSPATRPRFWKNS